MLPETREHLYDDAVSDGWLAIHPDNCKEESQATEFNILSLWTPTQRKTLLITHEQNFVFAFPKRLIAKFCVSLLNIIQSVLPF
jgi:hypothetical protein